MAVLYLYVKAQLLFIEEIQQQLRKEKAKHLALETRVRVTKEFSELISQMQEDYRSEIRGPRAQLCVIKANYRSCYMMTQLSVSF